MRGSSDQHDAENVAIEDGEQSEEEKKEEGGSVDQPTLLAKAIRTGSIGS